MRCSHLLLRPLICVLICGASVDYITAGQQRAAGAIDVGVVNVKALRMPIPSYPVAARKAGTAGKVEVRVLINRKGRVTRATVLSGPRLLRREAINSARQSTFPPSTTWCDACPYVTGTLVYTFINK